MQNLLGIGFTGVVGEDIEEVHDCGRLGERAVGDLDHVVFIFAPGVQDHGADIPLDAAVVTAVFGGDCLHLRGRKRRIVDAQIVDAAAVFRLAGLCAAQV